MIVTDGSRSASAQSQITLGLYGAKISNSQDLHPFQALLSLLEVQLVHESQRLLAVLEDRRHREHLSDRPYQRDQQDRHCQGYPVMDGRRISEGKVIQNILKLLILSSLLKLKYSHWDQEVQLCQQHQGNQSLPVREKKTLL